MDKAPPPRIIKSIANVRHDARFIVLMTAKKQTPEIILLIGIPAAGKSTFYEQQFRDSHVKLSLDDVKSRKRENAILESCLGSQRSVVIDNTNATASDRARYTRPAQAAGFQVKGFFFEPDLKESLNRNSRRESGRRVPPAAIFAVLKRLEAPRLDEGFDELSTVRPMHSGKFSVEPWVKPATADSGRNRA